MDSEVKCAGLIADEMSDRIVETAKNLVTLQGVSNLTVRRILKELNITNRVFYNRFHNIEEVLDVVYKNTTLKMRESIADELDSSIDFFEHVMDVVVNSLIMSYDTKMQFNQYVFENDSLSQSNYEWWTGRIKSLIDYAMEHDYIKQVNSDVLSYSLWCFCRGYNADAVGRKIPKEEAVANFKYSFNFILEGLKK
jgi:AcrR family transcriptional regulator